MTLAHLSVLGLGGLLIAVPVLLHFLMQPKPVEMMFPALRFLQQRTATNQSRMRLRHLVLLMLRCLLIGLVALAFAGLSVASADFGNWLTAGGIGLAALATGLITAMAWFRENRNMPLVGILLTISTLLLGLFGWTAAQVLRNEAGGRLIGRSDAPVAAVVLIDNSPTMEFRFENQTRFEKAKGIAAWLINQMSVESQICVTATDHDTPFFSVDTAAAAKRLSKLDIVYQSATIPQTLARALPLIEKSELERKEVYLFTDLTKKSWTLESTEASLKRMIDNDAISIFVIDVGVKSPSNLSLHPLELSSATIPPRGELTITTRIDSIGAQAAPSVTFAVESKDPSRPVVRDGKTIFPEKMLIEKTLTPAMSPTGNDTATTPLRFSFSDDLEPGTYHGSVMVNNADGLPGDDRRYFSFEVKSAAPLLIINGPDAIPEALTACIAPYESQDMGKSQFDVTTISQLDLQSPDQLDGFEMVYLLDPGPISVSMWDALHAFVENGNSLAIFLGHNALQKGAAAGSFLQPKATELLGGRLTFPFRAPEGDVAFSPDQLTHPVFKIFRKFESAVPWSANPVYYHWGIERDASWQQYPTEVVLRYTNREPAMLERTIGAGIVMVMTTPISEPAYDKDREIWNDLFVGDNWPIYQLTVDVAKYLLRGDRNPINVQVGQIITLENDLARHPESYRAFSPIAEKPPTTTNTDQGLIRYKFVDSPGNYYLVGSFDGQSISRGFSANLDSRETVLTRASQDEVDLVLGKDRYTIATEQSEIELQQGTARKGQEFFPLLMLLALVVMGVEHLLSNRFYKG
jgi:uncharacterized membrane protein YfcA